MGLKHSLIINQKAKISQLLTSDPIGLCLASVYDRLRESLGCERGFERFKIFEAAQVSVVLLCLDSFSLDSEAESDTPGLLDEKPHGVSHRDRLSRT